MLVVRGWTEFVFAKRSSGVSGRRLLTGFGSEEVREGGGVLLFSFGHIVLALLAIQINFASASGGDAPVSFRFGRIWFFYFLALKAGVPFETVVSAHGWFETDLHRVVLVWGSETALMEGYDGSTALPLDDWLCVRCSRC